MEDIKLYQSKWQLLLMVLGTSIFVGLGAFLIIQAPEGMAKDLYYTIGILSIVIFGFVFLNLLGSLFTRKPMIEITSLGFIDRGSVLKTNFVPWSNVLKVEEYGIKSMTVKQAFIKVTIKDTDLFLEGKNKVLTFLYKWNRNFSDKFINISVQNYKLSQEEVLELFISYYNNSKVETDE